MAQGANLDTTWRGLREIVSPIVGLTRSQVEALSALGLTGEIDGEFFIVVGVGRGNVPVATKYWVNKESYVMTVAQCYELLSLELFDIIVDENIKGIVWGKKIGNEEEEEEETFDSAQHDEARYGVEEELAKIAEEIEKLSPGAIKAASASSASAASKAKRGGETGIGDLQGGHQARRRVAQVARQRQAWRRWPRAAARLASSPSRPSGITPSRSSRSR